MKHALLFLSIVFMFWGCTKDAPSDNADSDPSTQEVIVEMDEELFAIYDDSLYVTVDLDNNQTDDIEFWSTYRADASGVSVKHCQVHVLQRHVSLGVWAQYDSTASYTISPNDSVTNCYTDNFDPFATYDSTLVIGSTNRYRGVLHNSSTQTISDIRYENEDIILAYRDASVISKGNSQFQTNDIHYGGWENKSNYFLKFNLSRDGYKSEGWIELSVGDANQLTLVRYGIKSVD